ncbi:hypothetical protein HOY80DRAFT_1040728 [Tuber brumale]|nr:hypothetical protein HOY80DRAFT_1040728 [Tuber brumale]
MASRSLTYICVIEAGKDRRKEERRMEKVLENRMAAQAFREHKPKQVEATATDTIRLARDTLIGGVVVWLWRKPTKCDGGTGVGGHAGKPDAILRVRAKGKLIVTLRVLLSGRWTLSGNFIFGS